jgi:tRNA 5-methylaminomethyl-2-thiouridine biosynthesis bifunctional protein
LLRLERLLPLAAMRDRLSQQGLPDDWLQAVDAPTADRLCSFWATGHGAQAWATGHPAWWFRDGGWADPAAIVRAGLVDSGAETRFGVAVDRLRRRGLQWQLLDADGGVITETDAVVLANADDVARLVGPGAGWPLARVRGQITVLPDSPDLPAPGLPIADAGYLLTLGDGRRVCGATSQASDNDPECRDDDHRQNLARLQRLTGLDRPPALERVIGGRVGWRLTTPDRLPLVGPVVDSGAPSARARQDQPRFQPRIEGLYLLTALGSRGITQAALAGELLAACLTGAPMPVPASLVDAVDNARFAARALRGGVPPTAPSVEDD